MLVLILLEVVYLVAVNALLASNLVRDGVGSAEGIQLEYASAWSWIPGRFHVRELDLRFEDYNVEFELRIAGGTLTLNLSALAFKRLHVQKLRAENVSFRMRHKVPAIGNNAPRLAAYPPIAGFPDPPLQRGPPPPPTADPESLWSLQVENLVAEVRELWILEYRFRGDAEARGSFLIRPALQVRVEPAALQFRRGSLHVAQNAVAKDLRGEISFRMPNLDVQATEGNAVFSQISTEVDLTLAGGDLGFLDVYSLPHTPLSFRGPARWSFQVKLEKGVVARPSKVTLNAPKLEAKTPVATLVGAAQLVLGRETEEQSLSLQGSLQDAKLLISDSCASPPQLTRLTSSIELKGVDLSQPMEPGALSLSGSARASDLSCLDALSSDPGSRLGGSSEASFELSRDGTGHGSGKAALDIRQGQVNYQGSRVQGNLHALARFQLGKNQEQASYAEGAVSVNMTSAGSLLSVTIAPLFSKLISGALGVDELDATVAFHAEPDRVVLELTSARTGAITGKGHGRIPSDGESKAALLFSSGPIHVGVELAGSNTDISPLVSESWLDETWRNPKSGSSNDAAGPAPSQ